MQQQQHMPQDPPAYAREIMQAMEGLHRSVRDLANQNLKNDPQQFSANFAQIEKRISALGDLMDRHSDPALADMGQQLDQLMKSTERLAEIQIKQLAQFEEFRETNQPPEINLDGLENGIHNLYERLDTLERTAAAPSKELDTIARSVAGIASAVGHLQEESMGQKLPEIYAQLQEIGDRISVLDDKHSTRVTDHIRREMQGVRSDVTGAFEPRFDSIEARLEGLQENLAQAPMEPAQPDLSELHAIEQRLNDAISSLDAVRDAPAQMHSAQDNEDVLGALNAMEDRLNAAIDAIDQTQHTPNAPTDNFFQSLKGMEDRIVDAIQALRSATEQPHAAEAPSIDLDGLRAIEVRLAEQLDALDSRLHAAPAPAAPTQAAPQAMAPLPVAEQTLALDRDDHFAAWDAAAEVEAPEIPQTPEATPQDDYEQASPSFEQAIGADEPTEDNQSFGLGLAELGGEESSDAQFSQEQETEAEPSFGYGQHEEVPPLAEPAPMEATSLDEATAPDAEEVHEDVPQPRSSFDSTPSDFNDGPRSLSDFDDAPTPLAPTTADAPAPSADDFSARELRTNEGQGQNDTVNHARQSFIAAARSAAVAKNDTPEQTTSLLGRAFARIKAGKDEKAEVEAPAPTHVDSAAKSDRLSAGENHLHAASADIEDDAAEMEVAAEQRRKRFMMPFGSKQKDETPEAPAAEEIERPKSAFDDEHSIALDGQPDYRDAEDDDLDEDEGKESFLSRHRQPILLGASIVAIIAMTANLINQNTNSSGNQASGGAPAITEPAEAEMSSLSDAAMPRQIDMAQSSAVEVGELAALTDQNNLANQNVGLVAPQQQAVDQQLTTASISPEPEKAALEALVPEVGPEGLRMAAAAGDVRAQFEMGAILMEGQAVPKDSQAASKWFEHAAAAGYAPAQYRLAAAFEHGIGVPQNIEQAKEWYKRAAENGNRMAMHNLAALYASADESQQDFSKAGVWFQRAADQGVVDSQFNLGMLFARGLGVEQDLNQSYFWFALAAMQGDQDAKGARDDVARSIDPAQMQILKEQLANWQPEEVALGSNYAPIGTWDPEFDPGPSIDKKEVVLGVQSALMKLGFSVGQPDGVMGPKTEDAIRGFERALGMNESGTINPRLMAILSSQPI
jgi:localization factor PodJL